MRTAVQAGRCREYKGLFYLPRSSVGKGRKWEDKKEMERRQERGAEDWDTFGDALKGSIGEGG